MKIVEKDVVENEVIRELNWKEKIVIKIFKKTFFKIYGIAGKNIVNQILS